MNAASCTHPHNRNSIVIDADKNNCLPTGRDVVGQRFVKYLSADYSNVNSMTSYAYYEDAACTEAYWAHPPTATLSCTTARYGTDPLPCTVSPCSTQFPTSGDQMAYYFASDAAGSLDELPPVNYAKLRFYQDSTCALPETYMEAALDTIDFAAHSAYQPIHRNVAENIQYTEMLSATGLAIGYQPFDGHATGQAMYVESSSAGACTAINIGVQSANLKSIECFSSPSVLHYPTEMRMHNGVIRQENVGDPYYEVVGPCNLYTSIDCSGTVASVVTNTTACNPQIYAKAESFNIGVEWIENSYRSYNFYEHSIGSEIASQECGGQPVVISGQLDTCQVSTNVAMRQADNAPFIKITGSLRSTNTIDSSYHTNSDCTGVGLQAESRNLGTCRGGLDPQGDLKVGTMMLSAKMSPAEKLGAVLSRGLLADSDTAGATSDAIGCPEIINYVDQEGLYELSASNSLNDHRVCGIVFQGPPGTTLRFDWTNFGFITGGCSGSPLTCICDTEHVVIRDGARPDSRQIGQRICGNSFNGQAAPNSIIFSGNTARIDVETTMASSTLSIWVSHLVTKVNFENIPNPSFRLGGDITIKWSMESSAASWSKCDSGLSELSNNLGIGEAANRNLHPDAESEPWSRQLTCARSAASDHGWIGLFRADTCQTGQLVSVAHTITEDPNDTHPGFTSYAYAQGQKPHQCYVAARSIPVKHTRGEVIFHYPEYREGGWYDLRYFAGDASGIVCEVNDNDPESSTKNKRCLYEPISTMKIYISNDVQSYEGMTLKRQLPGYELTTGRGNSYLVQSS